MEISPLRRIQIGVFVIGLMVLVMPFTAAWDGSALWVLPQAVGLIAVASAAFGAGSGWQEIRDRTHGPADVRVSLRD